MASVPSIKGTAFTKVVEDVAKLLATHALSRSEAQRWLQPDDFAVLEREVQAARWYDIRVYERMSKLLLDVEGHGDTSYLRERGRQTAKRLLQAGVYAQLEYLYEEKGDRPAAADMRQRRLQRAGAPELVPLFRVMPRYPRDALRRRVNGWVDMLITQRPDGTVSKVEVIGSEPAGVFDQAAIDAVRQWKFKPRVIDGQAVDSRGRQRLEFRMAD